MNKTQEAKLNMYHTVLYCCDLNSDIIGNMDALVKTVADFKRITLAIDGCLDVLLQKISGHATNKNLLRTALIEEAASIAARVFSYGKSSNNTLLQGKADYAVWQLERLKDEEIPPTCRIISQAARPYISLLGSYNLKVADLNAFDVNIAAFVACVTTPHSAIINRSIHNATLKDLYQLGDDMLRGHMDRQLREFKKTDFEFYLNYKKSREIVNNKTTATQIKGAVVNKKTKELIAGATITVMENETSVTSDEKGNYVIKPLPPDTYTLKFEMEGFETKIITGAQVKLGKIKTVKVSLVPKEPGGGLDAG